MISANQALNRIDNATLKVQQDEVRLGKIIEAAGLEISQLRAEQAELYRALARIRLDALKQDQILRSLDQSEQRALAAIEEQKQKLLEISQQQDAIKTDITTLHQRRELLSNALSEAANAITTQHEATEKRIATNIDWQAQSAKVFGLAAQSEASEDKAQMSETDREQKSKPYLADPLFMYLWQRNYGTSSYRAGSLTRWGDSFVARVVHYEQARQNYYALNEIPKRLREHAERVKADLAEEESKLIALERSALEQDGIIKLEETHQAAMNSLDAIDQNIDSLENNAAALAEQRKLILDDTGQHGLGNALQELAASLQRNDLRVLMREALETPTPEDERIVERLQQLQSKQEQLDNEADEARSTAIELAKRRNELEKSRQDFRRTGYEQQGGTFSNDKLIGDILGGIIGGVLSSRELRDALQSGYRRGNSPQSRPKSGGFSGSRGGFGGGFGGGGRSGGGGFKTGGGF